MLLMTFGYVHVRVRKLLTMVHANWVCKYAAQQSGVLFLGC
jgi:hypothetical protein